MFFVFSGKRFLFFYSLASIEQKKQKQALHERNTDTRHPILFMVLRVFLLFSHVLPGEQELDGVTRKASKGRFLLLFVWAYFLFAASMRPTKTL